MLVVCIHMVIHYYNFVNIVHCQTVQISPERQRQCSMLVVHLVIHYFTFVNIVNEQ
jgi:ABC-type uncharacterized transport system permease subunit